MIEWLYDYWQNTNAFFGSSYAALWVTISALLFTYLSCRWWWRGMRADMARVTGIFGREPAPPPPTPPVVGPLERKVKDEQGRVWLEQARRDPVTGQPVSWAAVKEVTPPVIIRR